MKLALLIGNRFNPWHFQGYRYLRGNPRITVFRAQSEIQRYFDERNDSAFGFAFEEIRFDTESVFGFRRLLNRLRSMLYSDIGAPEIMEPRIVPFHDRLRGFDLIQSWELFTDWSSEALIAHEKYGVPFVVMVWDNIPLNMDGNPERLAIKQRVIAGADLFIVHTERSRRMLHIEGVSEDRIVRIDPGVDVDLFSPGPCVRPAFDLSDEDLVILFVGWFLPRKGLDFLLYALRELLHDPALSQHRIRLLIVGSGPGKPRIEALIERLGIGHACRFAGSLPYGKMPEAYRCADVFVLPSIATPEWQEQFGMCLMEAMACGAPVVTTWSGAIPEIVGDHAVLCQPNDFLSLTNALHDLIQNPARRGELAAAGRDYARGRFDLRRFADRLSGVYETLLAR